MKYQALKMSIENVEVLKLPNLDYDASTQTCLLEGKDQGEAISAESSKTLDEVEDQRVSLEDET